MQILFKAKNARYILYVPYHCTLKMSKSVGVRSVETRNGGRQVRAREKECQQGGQTRAADERHECNVQRTVVTSHCRKESCLVTRKMSRGWTVQGLRHSPDPSGILTCGGPFGLVEPLPVPTPGPLFISPRGYLKDRHPSTTVTGGFAQAGTFLATRNPGKVSTTSVAFLWKE